MEVHLRLIPLHVWIAGFLDELPGTLPELATGIAQRVLGARSAREELGVGLGRKRIRDEIANLVIGVRLTRGAGRIAALGREEGQNGVP